jgi:hypothetical protein
MKSELRQSAALKGLNSHAALARSLSPPKKNQSVGESSDRADTIDSKDAAFERFMNKTSFDFEAIQRRFMSPSPDGYDLEGNIIYYQQKYRIPTPPQNKNLPQRMQEKEEYKKKQAKAYGFKYEPAELDEELKRKLRRDDDRFTKST